MDRIRLIQLVNQAEENNQKAIEELYRMTYSVMYSLAMTLCENHSDAEDILQESYIRAFSKLDTLAEKAAFINWLRKIVVNVWRNYHSRKITMPEVNLSDAPEESVLLYEEQDSPSELAEKAETDRAIRSIVDGLPENQRVCMLLFYYENMKIEEIADVLEIPVGSVKSRLHYGRKAVEKGLKSRGLFSGGLLVAPKAAIGAEAADSALLAKILAALQTAANSGSAVSAGGIAFKLCLGLASLLAIGGLAAIPALTKDNFQPAQPSVTAHSTTATAAATTTSVTGTTASSTTVTTTATTTAATTPKPYTSFEYEDYDGGIMLTSYTGTEPDVIIPDSIDGKPVTAVGSGAFNKSRILRSVNIPDSVKSIGDNAFRECRGLQTVTFSSGLTSIGSSAFLGCTGISRFEIPGSVQKIGVYSFSYCSRLERVAIGGGTSVIGYAAFLNCPDLSSVSLPASVSSIGVDSFEGASGGLVLTVPANSYSLDYAVQNGFTYTVS